MQANGDVVVLWSLVGACLIPLLACIVNDGLTCSPTVLTTLTGYFVIYDSDYFSSHMIYIHVYFCLSSCSIVLFFH